MKKFLLVVALAASGCGVSTGDAKDFIKTLDAANSTTDPELQTRILMRGCSEISSCARGCKKKVLEACTDGLVDDSMQATLFASCFDDYRAARDKPEVITAGDWFRKSYLPPYADKAREKLSGDEGAKLEALRKSLHL
jgi:hypothetical protein